MISLTEAFLAHDSKAYPCGISVKESRKMLTMLPDFREVVFVSMKTRLRTTLTKGVSTPKKRATVRG